MAGRLTRFLNLERRRALPTDAAGTVEERFQAERAAQLRSGVELEVAHAEEQPFLRCPACEADNGKFAERCVNCQGSLAGEEVRAWNEHFWSRRRAILALEAKAQAEAGPLEGGTHDFGVALAQAVAREQKEKLGWMRADGDNAPWGVRALRGIEEPANRFFVGATTAGVFFGALATAFNASGGLQLGAAAVVVLIASVFVPRRPTRY